MGSETNDNDLITTELAHAYGNEVAFDDERFDHSVLDNFYNIEKHNVSKRPSLIAFMLHTRDIVSGRGKYEDFYRLVVTFDKIIDSKEPYVSRQKTETMRVILHKVIETCVCMHGYGSWKDVKYLLNLLRDMYGEESAAKKPMFKYVVYMISHQLKDDAVKITDTDNANNISLAGKWAPREKSKKFGWQAKYIAKHFYHEWCDEKKNLKGATRKCLTHYRKTIASLNRVLKTPQINQCAHDWASIDFKNSVSRTTMEKHGMAFEYVMPCGGLRTLGRNIWNHNYSDRMRCRMKYISNKRCRDEEYWNFVFSKDSAYNDPKNIYHPRYDWVWYDPLIHHTY